MRTFFHVLLGIILGIILLVIAVGGAVYGVISLPVGDVLGTFNLNIIPPDHVLFPQSILEIVQGAVADVQNLNNLSIKELSEKYGIPIPADIHGISLDPLLSATIGTLTSNPDTAITEVVNSVNLENLLSLAGVPKENLTKYPIFNDNMQSNIQDTMNDITSILDANSLTLRSLEDNFGFTLGTMELLTQLQDLSISKFADAIKTIEIGTVLDVDADKFIPNSNIKVYARVDKYEEIDPTVLPLPQSNALSTMYIADIVDGKQVKKELRFVQKEVPNTDPIEHKFVVDNSSHKEGFDYAANKTTYYRHIEFEPYDAEKHTDNDIYVDYVINSFVDDGKGVFSPKQIGKISADELFVNDETSLKDAIATKSITVTDSQIATLSGIKFINAENVKEGPIAYGYVGTADKDTKLEVGNTGFFKAHTGTADMAIQHLSGLTIDGLSNPQDAIMSLKLKDILGELSEDNVLYSLANCQIGDIPNEIQTLPIKSIMPDMRLSAYVPNSEGGYVYIAPKDEGGIDIIQPFGTVRTGYYTIFDETKAEHKTLERYAIDSAYAIANAKDRKTPTQLFIYDSGVFKQFTGTILDANTTYYVKTDSTIKADSRLLQRIAYTNIKGISTLINDIVLGDIMDITEDNILYAFAGKTIQEIPNALDNLSINQVIKNIKVGAYIKNANGNYVKVINNVDNSFYYTVYIPDKNYGSDVTLERCDYDDNYIVASKKQIKDTTITKYYHDGVTFKAFTSGEIIDNSKGTVYIQATTDLKPDSKLLQRIETIKINNLTNLMNSLVLGDTMTLDLNKYELASSPYKQEVKYFYVKDNMYQRAIFKDEHTLLERDNMTTISSPVYIIASLGESHAVIQRLAGVSIDGLGNSMKAIMDSLLFDDLFDIIQYDQVRNVKTSETIEHPKYLVEETPGYAGNTFIPDEKGSYYNATYTYVKLTQAQKEEILKKSTCTMKQLFSGIPDTEQLKATIANQNIYVKHENKFYANPAWATSLLTTGKLENIAKLYYVDENGTESKDCLVADIAQPLLFVEYLGTYIPYDNTKPQHGDLPLAIRLENGYMYDTNGTYSYDCTTGTIVNNINSSIKFSKLDVVDGASCYYNKLSDYTQITENADKESQRFAKKQTFKTYNESTETYVNAYISDVQVGTSAKVVIVREKSATLLRNLAITQQSITSIDNVLKTFTMGQILDIEADSFLDGFNATTLQELPSAITTQLTTMTMGDLVKKLNITSMDLNVLSLIGDITFTKFLTSLTYDPNIGSITLDFNKLFVS